MARRSKHEHMTVLVKVHPALKEYIVSINSGDTLFPERGSHLWGLVSMHLQLTPPDYTPTPDTSTPQDCIRISLFDSHARTWCRDLNRTIWQDSIFRNYLGPEAQRAIARHLMADFKHTFRAYMTGAINNNPDISIAEAIDEFCSDYKITMQQLTVDLLRKDWYRWRMNSQGQTAAPSSWNEHSTSE